MDVSDEVWILVHWNYGMSKVVQKFYLVKINNYSYFTVPVNGQLNQRNNESFNLKFTNSKIMMMITIIIDSIITYHIVNM